MKEKEKKKEKKKKRLLAVIAVLACLLCTACGGKNPAPKDADGNIVTELDTPSGLSFKEAGDHGELSWNKVDNAAGYRIYEGSSRYSDDFNEITEKAVTEPVCTVSREPGRYYKVSAINGEVVSELSEACAGEMELFGENVLIYSPQDDPEQVNKELFALFNKQETSQFDSRRYSVLFKPGEYSETIDLKIGFYTEVNGLGMLPGDTILQRFNCPATWLGDAGNHNATCNFWRGISNLQINDNVMWAVSQATFMRRMQINGNLSLHDNYGWASGGFLADTVVTGLADSGSQQQWLTRNSDFSKWQNHNWNIVFMGIKEGKAPTAGWPAAAYTVVEETPVVREKPYLVYQGHEYAVFVPGLIKQSRGVSWAEGEQEGTLLPLDDFYVARFGKDNADSLNSALDAGKNLILTPGIYELDKAIRIQRENTILLGMGLATLVPTKGNACLEVCCEKGVTVAGVLFDAGETRSDTLLLVGNEKNNQDNSENPILLADVFFRVGGANKADTSVESCAIINANSVIGDNFWVWRADHGDGVGWSHNTAPNGIIINGDNVSIYALMVEHFQEYQTLWKGEGGLVVFYQSELPYDVPFQDAWCSRNGEKHGYASYYVADDVKTHSAYGIGIYSYNRDAIVEELCAMEVPEVEGMNIHNVCAVMITGNPGISNVINTYGDPCYAAGSRSIIIDFQKTLEEAGVFKE